MGKNSDLSKEWIRFLTKNIGTPMNPREIGFVLFVLFGALLDRAGGGNWFIKVAIALLGALRGGPRKLF